MIDQLNIYGMTKLEVSIERIKQIEPRGGQLVSGILWREGLLRYKSTMRHGWSQV